MKSRLLPILLAGIMIFQLFSPMGTLTAHATTLSNAGETEIIHSGTGDISWSIDSNGHLKVWGDGDYETTSINIPTWCEYAEEIITAEVNINNITSLRSMFSGCKNLTRVDLSNLDTTNVTIMDYTFSGCSSLTMLDLSNFVTTNVTIMNYLFSGCKSLTTLDLSGFDTTNVTEMYGMFSGCSGLKELDLLSFNTTNVTNMGLMFQDCSSLTTLDLSKFDMLKVLHANRMVYGCNNLKQLKTPLHVYVTDAIKLPEGNNENWFDKDGNMYTIFPRNASESIVLRRLGEGEEFPEDESQSESYDIEVFGSFVAGSESAVIFTVDIEWTEMEFVYHEANEPVWDPETHTYSTTEEGYWEGTGTITVTNHSNTAITAESTYTALAGYETAGLNFGPTLLELESAEIGNEEKVGYIGVTPYGTLPEMDGQNKIGTITVELAL